MGMFDLNWKKRRDKCGGEFESEKRPILGDMYYLRVLIYKVY